MLAFRTITLSYWAFYSSNNCKLSEKNLAVHISKDVDWQKKLADHRNVLLTSTWIPEVESGRYLYRSAGQPLNCLAPILVIKPGQQFLPRVVQHNQPSGR